MGDSHPTYGYPPGLLKILHLPFLSRLNPFAHLLRFGFNGSSSVKKALSAFSTTGFSSTISFSCGFVGSFLIKLFEFNASYKTWTAIKVSLSTRFVWLFKKIISESGANVVVFCSSADFGGSELVNGADVGFSTGIDAFWASAASIIGVGSDEVSFSVVAFEVVVEGDDVVNEGNKGLTVKSE